MKIPHITLEDTKLKNSFFGIVTSTQRLQFTNQCVFSFRFTNLLVCFFSGPPPGPVAHRAEGCNKERRMVVKLFCLRTAIISIVSECI